MLYTDLFRKLKLPLPKNVLFHHVVSQDIILYTHTVRISVVGRYLLVPPYENTEYPVDSPNGGGLVRCEGQVSVWPRLLP